MSREELGHGGLRKARQSQKTSRILLHQVLGPDILIEFLGYDYMVSVPSVYDPAASGRRVGVAVHAMTAKSSDGPNDVPAATTTLRRRYYPRECLHRNDSPVKTAWCLCRDRKFGRAQTAP